MPTRIDLINPHIKSLNNLLGFDITLTDSVTASVIVLPTLKIIFRTK